MRQPIRCTHIPKSSDTPDMSRSIASRVTCPLCNGSQVATIWTSINVTADPTLKEPFLRSELNVLRCKRCTIDTPIETSVLYHDMELRLMIWQIPDRVPGIRVREAPELPPFPGIETYLLRVVGSHAEMVEKIIIFDAGLDDRVVEMAKRFAPVTATEIGESGTTNVWFAGENRDGVGETLEFEIVRGERVESWSISSKGVLPACQKILSTRGQIGAGYGQWARVDQTWVDRSGDQV